MDSDINVCADRAYDFVCVGMRGGLRRQSNSMLLNRLSVIARGRRAWGVARRRTRTQTPPYRGGLRVRVSASGGLGNLGETPPAGDVQSPEGLQIALNGPGGGLVLAREGFGNLGRREGSPLGQDRPESLMACGPRGREGRAPMRRSLRSLPRLWTW